MPTLREVQIEHYRGFYLVDLLERIRVFFAASR
jgi:hypothetical protein